MPVDPSVIRHFFTVTEVEDEMLTAISMPGERPVKADSKSDLMCFLQQIQGGTKPRKKQKRGQR